MDTPHYFLETIRTLAKERSLHMETSFGDWIISLSNTKYKVTRHIMGYTFPLNNVVAAKLCDDKSALSSVLEQAGIPCVSHTLLLTPEHTWFLGEDGNAERIKRFLQEHPFPIVVKSNEGTSGKDVFLIHNHAELEYTLLQLFQKHRGVALSPFMDISMEYRVIVLDDQELLTYGKQRGEGEWKHNLSHGGKCEEVRDPAMRTQLHHLAKEALHAIGARLGAVDIVNTKEGYKIIEINGGISINKAAMQLENGDERSKEVYRSILIAMFG